MLSATILASVLVAIAPVSVWRHFLVQGEVDCNSGAHVLLILLDLDGDGKDEVLLADSSHCGSGGCGWLVYTPTQSPGRMRYAGLAEFGMVAYSRGARVLLGSWHMSAGESVQTCWRLEQQTLRTLPVAECRRVRWAPAGLPGDARYRWILDHEPSRFGSLGTCSAGPRRDSWVDQHQQPASSRRIPDLARMLLVNSEDQER